MCQKDIDHIVPGRVKYLVGADRHEHTNNKGHRCAIACISTTVWVRSHFPKHMQGLLGPYVLPVSEKCMLNFLETIYF